METLKKGRNIARTLFTRAKKDFEANLESHIDKLTAAFRKLQLRAEKLFNIDERVKELWISSDDEMTCEEKYIEDCSISNYYKSDWERAKVQYDNAARNDERIKRSHKCNSTDISNNTVKSMNSQHDCEKSTCSSACQLPKFELQKFDGNTKNWIGFWCQFQKIDSDNTIDDGDKFQYLYQCTVPDTPARALVDSFPSSGANYKKAIEQLKSRFGRDDMLIDIYVRELLNLVQAKDNTSYKLGHLYDKLNTQLQALQSLGVTVMSSLVESALPESVLRAWQRCQVHEEKGEEHLNRLMQFLKCEAESEERIQLARSGIASGGSLPSVSSQPTPVCLLPTEDAAIDRAGPAAVKQECGDDANDDAAALPVDRAEPATVKQECSDAATDGLEDSCASSECSGEYLKEEPAATAGCNAELLMDMRSHMGEGLYSCDVCHKRFIDMTTLTMHKEIHKQEMKSSYSCDICNKNFTGTFNLVVHMRSHTGERPYSCDICQKRFSAKKYLTQHKETHMPDTMRSSYSCDICNKNFKGKSYLVVHMRSHTGERPYSCDVCQKRFLQKMQLESHKKTHMPDTMRSSYSCYICNKNFKGKSYLVVHIRSHTGERPYSCDVCQKRFLQKNQLKNHKKTHMPDTMRSSYSCDICNKNFTEKSSLLIHMRSHTGERPYSCDVCQKRFLRKSHLITHKETHKPDTMKSSYSCDICNKKFREKSYLVVHMRSHTGERPYSCDVCPKRFLRESYLIRHKDTHKPDTMKSSYYCNICNKKFREKSYLVVHMRSHTGERPYSCDVCPKRFLRESYLIRHKDTHKPDTMKSSYSCNICNRNFREKYHLLTHKRSHTRKRPYSCDVCQMRFLQKSYLIRHKDTHKPTMKSSMILRRYL